MIYVSENLENELMLLPSKTEPDCAFNECIKFPPISNIICTLFHDYMMKLDNQICWTYFMIYFEKVFMSHDALNHTTFRRACRIFVYLILFKTFSFFYWNERSAYKALFVLLFHNFFQYRLVRVYLCFWCNFRVNVKMCFFVFFSKTVIGTSSFWYPLSWMNSTSFCINEKVMSICLLHPHYLKERKNIIFLSPGEVCYVFLVMFRPMWSGPNTEHKFLFQIFLKLASPKGRNERNKYR